MAQHDVIVVGGGPGGSTAAWRLARAGLRPLLLDAAVFPRVKVCAGWVTPEALADVRGRSGEVSAHDPGLLGVPVRVRRRAPRDALAAAGQLRHPPAGVRSLPARPRARGRRRRARGRPGDRGDRDAGRDPGHEPARHLHGVRRRSAPAAIGARWPRLSARSPSEEEVVIAQESETRLPAERVEALGAALGGARSSTSSRTSRATAGTSPRVTCSTSASAASRARARTCRDGATRSSSALRAAGRLPADLAIEPFRGHAYVVRRRAPRRLAGDRFCLVGDAAGLARDLSGEGIGPAIRSGLLAAEAVEAHLRRGAGLEAYAARDRAPVRIGRSRVARPTARAASPTPGRACSSAPSSARERRGDTSSSGASSGCGR